jgi:AAA15 family ATPase/GTPase
LVEQDGQDRHNQTPEPVKSPSDTDRDSAYNKEGNGFKKQLHCKLVSIETLTILLGTLIFSVENLQLPSYSIVD